MIELPLKLGQVFQFRDPVLSYQLNIEIFRIECPSITKLIKILDYYGSIFFQYCRQIYIDRHINCR